MSSPALFQSARAAIARGVPRIAPLVVPLVLGVGALTASPPGLAQADGMTPVGLWKTVDEKSGEPKALVRIVDDNGRLTGRIEKLFNPSRPNPVCEKCTDDLKDAPIVGLAILRDVRPVDAHWGDGRILDPEVGKFYKVKITPVEAGRKLEVRGYIGTPLLGRTQTWIREQ